MNTPRLRVYFYILAAFALLPTIAEPEAAWGGTPPLPGGHMPITMGYAAEVGSGKIGIDQVFEVWSPVWYETLLRIRGGKLDVQAGDAKLQEEWKRALIALIKDEVLYQEAIREFNSEINNFADQLYRMQPPESYQKSRAEFAAVVREKWQQNMDREMRELGYELVKRSGGQVKLRKVLVDRGITYHDWQERLKKKVLTNSYLHMVIKFRAPSPGPKRVQDYYASHADEFTKPGVVSFSHIFFSKDARGEDAAREAATEVWGMLTDQEISFEDAARQYSDDPPSRDRGGVESEYEAEDPEREAWLADVRIALREETAGELAPILESPFGYHLAILSSIGPDRKVPFQEVRKEIEKKLEEQAWQVEVDKYFAAARKHTAIRILTPNFPRELSCAVHAASDIPLPSFHKLRREPLPGVEQ